MKVLIIITSTYPYGYKEPFLENEVKYIESFDKVVFITSRAEGSIRKGRLPDKAECFYINAIEDNYKKRSLRFWFSNLCWRELFFLIKTNRFSYYNLKLLQKYYLLALNTLERATYIINKKFGGFKNDEVVIYSYWLVDHALTNIILSKKYHAVKSISRTHRYDLYEYGEKDGYIPFRKAIISKLDGIYAISQDGYNYINNYKISNNIFVSRLGVEDNGINHNSESQQLVIVSCSWCRPVKRINLIIEALSKINNTQIVWHHFGDGELFKLLKKEAENSLSNGISYNFHGETSNENILEFYKNNHIDVFVNVSASEGVPVSIMEAMSFGIPTIATDVGGTCEIVRDGHNGFLLKKDFIVEDLICCILKINSLSNLERKLMRSNARNTWNESYNARKNYKSFYNSIKI